MLLAETLVHEISQLGSQEVFKANNLEQISTFCLNFFNIDAITCRYLLLFTFQFSYAIAYVLQLNNNNMLMFLLLVILIAALTIKSNCVQTEYNPFSFLTHSSSFASCIATLAVCFSFMLPFDLNCGVDAVHNSCPQRSTL